MTSEEVYLCLTILAASVGTVIIWNELFSNISPDYCSGNSDCENENDESSD